MQQERILQQMQLFAEETLMRHQMYEQWVSGSYMYLGCRYQESVQHILVCNSTIKVAEAELKRRLEKIQDLQVQLMRCVFNACDCAQRPAAEGFTRQSKLPHVFRPGFWHCTSTREIRGIT